MKRKILYLYLLLAMASLFACIMNGGEVIKKQGPGIGFGVSETETGLLTPGSTIDDFQIKNVTITQDGKELYLGTSNSKYYTILVSRKIDGRWTVPEIVKSIENPE